MARCCYHRHMDVTSIIDRVSCMPAKDAITELCQLSTDDIIDIVRTGAAQNFVDYAIALALYRDDKDAFMTLLQHVDTINLVKYATIAHQFALSMPISDDKSTLTYRIHQVGSYVHDYEKTLENVNKEDIDPIPDWIHRAILREYPNSSTEITLYAIGDHRMLFCRITYPIQDCYELVIITGDDGQKYTSNLDIFSHDFVTRYHDAYYIRNPSANGDERMAIFSSLRDDIVSLYDRYNECHGIVADGAKKLDSAIYDCVIDFDESFKCGSYNYHQIMRGLANMI